MVDFKPWEHVEDPSYFRKVLGNMVKLGFGPKREIEGRVRFGLTGKGYAPNYQIEGADGSKHCFRGLGHSACLEDDEEFSAQRLSDAPYSYEDVQGLLKGLIGK